MKTVRQIADEIVRREGGYVNDPHDPGGATKFGVTIHTMKRLGLDLDRDGDVDAHDVQALTREQATDIFIRHYFDKPRINLLPEPLRPSVFDMYVNAGGNAVKILQRLIGRVRRKGDCRRCPRTGNGRRHAQGLRRRRPHPGRRLRHCPAQLLLPHRRPATAKPQIRPHPRRQQGRLDQTGRGVHQPAIPSERRPVQGARVTMGVNQ